MQDPKSQSRFNFLFKSDAGTIDRPTWWKGTLALGLPLLVATLIWFVVSPYTHRELTKTSALVDPIAMGAFFYLLAYAVFVLLVAISFYNLSAKRFRALGLSTGLSGLIPLLALLAGAVHWIVPRSEDGVPMWAAWMMDALLLLATAYCVWELGLRTDKSAGNTEISI